MARPEKVRPDEILIQQKLLSENQLQIALAISSLKTPPPPCPQN